MKLLIFLLSIGTIYSQTNSYKFLMSDYDFTNQPSKEVVWKVIKSYPNNIMTSEDISILLKVSREYKVNPLVILMKAEQESGILRNNTGLDKYEIRKFRACGFGLYIASQTNRPNYTYGTNQSGKKAYYRYGGFETQISECARLLNEKFVEYYDEKYYSKNKSRPKVIIKDMDETEWKWVVKNAATYSFYRYCPYYGKFMNGRFENMGNKIIHSLWRDIKGRK